MMGQAAGGHFAAVKWLCSKRCRQLVMEASGDAMLAVQRAALTADRESVLVLRTQSLSAPDALGRSREWYCTQSDSAAGT